MTYGHTLNLCSAVSTHPEQWAASAAVPREQSGVRCLAQGPLSCGIEGGERALDIYSPHLQFLQGRDSNSQPFDYKSNSLTIKPRLPHLSCNTSVFILLFSFISLINISFKIVMTVAENIQPGYISENSVI